MHGTTEKEDVLHIHTSQKPAFVTQRVLRLGYSYNSTEIQRENFIVITLLFFIMFVFRRTSQ